MLASVIYSSKLVNKYLSTYSVLDAILSTRNIETHSHVVL